jgi:hypothetical protein
MSVFVRLSTLVAVGFGAVLLAGWLLIPWLGGPALFGGFQDILEMLWGEQVRAEALHTRDVAIQRCLEGKRQVVIDLRAGKLSLAEAADRFRELHTFADDGQDPILGPYAGVENSDEAVCRNIIRWAEIQTRDEPDAAQLLARLNRELADILANKKRPH